MNDFSAAKIVKGELFYWAADLRHDPQGWLVEEIFGDMPVRVLGPFEDKGRATHAAEALKRAFISSPGKPRLRRFVDAKLRRRRVD